MSTFDEIYDRHADAVFRYAWRQVGRRDIAEEIAAEAFMALHQHFTTIDVGQLPAWLFTVARNRAADYWRRRAVEERYARTLVPEPSAPASEHDGLQLIDHPSLKPIHRLCLRLRYGYGMSVAEAARVTGLSEVQVKGHLQYARHLLRKAFVQESR